MALTDRARRTERTEALLSEIGTLRTQFDVFRLLKKVCDLFGFSAFMVLRLPEASDRTIGDCTIITNWPTEMIAGYDALGLLQTSPLIRNMRRSTLPLVLPLDARTEASAATERSLSDRLFRRFGFLLGVAIPVHDAEGKRGLVCFEGDRSDLCHAELRDLTMLGVYAYEQLSAIAAVDRSHSVPLTDRERDCLSWTAEGKTSIEIADILGLSEHTVNHYLNRAAKKLGSVNRTQAVAKALRRGWIR